MLGIALGSFTQGFAQGINMGQQLHDIRKQRRLENDVEGITQKGKADYDKAVAAGEEAPDDFMSYYTRKIVDPIAARYLQDGDPAKAQAWTDWADSSTAKSSTKKFLTGLQQLNTGDTEAGINSMIKAVNANGYGIDGSMTAAEYYDENAGAVTGYRLAFTTKDGQEHVKNVATADLPQFFANLVNPKNAFEMDQQAKTDAAKADREVDTYKRKKQAEKELGVGAGGLTPAQYQNAIQEERKRIESDALISGEELTDAQKEQKAREIVDARFAAAGGGGAPAAPAGPQVTVDPETGEPVADTPTSDAADAAVPDDTALGASDADMQPSGPVGGGPLEAPGLTAATPAEATSQVDPTQQQAILAQATQMMKQGGNAQQIAQALVQAGIPPESWPQDLQLAARNAQPGLAP